MTAAVEPGLLALLLVIAGAAGVDLALTILVLGVAPLLGWSSPPGDLAYLQAPWVIVAGLVMYGSEAIMERHPAGFSVWHTFQRWVRLLGLILLAEMGTSGMPADVRWLVAAGMVALGLATYVASSGWQGMVILRRLPRGTQAMAAGGVDVAFAALLVLALDRPGQALLGFGAIAALVLPRLPLAVRGHRVVIDAGRSWVRGLVGPGGWVNPGDLPGTVRRALESREDRPGSAPRGVPALLLTGRLQRGWLLAGSGRAWFVPRRSAPVSLRRVPRADESTDPLYARFPVTAGDREGDLLIRKDGPGPRELEREIPLAEGEADG